MLNRRARAKILFLTPITALLLMMTIFPFVYLILISFTDRAATNPNTKIVWFENYTEIFQDHQFYQSVSITLIITIFSVFLEIFLGLILALSFTNLYRNLWFLRAIVMIPMAAAPVATLFNWRYMLNTSTGVINYIISIFGFSEVGWLDSKTVALTSIILVETWMWTPFVFILLTAALSSIDKNIVEAAQVDGANRFVLAKHIYIPILKPFLIIALVLRILDAAKSFDAIQILTSGGPGYDTASYNFLIYLNGIQYLNFGSAAAQAVILIIVLMIISRRFFNRLVREAVEN